jgi:hypothetical protein
MGEYHQRQHSEGVDMNKNLRVIILLVLGLMLIQTVSASIYMDDFTTFENLSSYNNITLEINPNYIRYQVVNNSNNWEAGMSHARIRLVNNIYEGLYGCGNDALFLTPRNTICYVNSTDGINFTKPNLGLINYGGNTNNNIWFQNTTNDANLFDWQYYDDGNGKPYKLLIGWRNLSDNGDHWRFNLWEAENFQTSPTYIKQMYYSNPSAIGSSDEPVALTFEENNWYIYSRNFTDLSGGRALRSVRVFKSNNNSFTNSIWSDLGIIDSSYSVYDQTHLVSSGDLIPNTNIRSVFWEDDTQYLNTNQRHELHLLTQLNPLSWKFREIGAYSLKTGKMGVIQITDNNNFDNSSVWSASGIIEDPITKNWRIFYSGSNVTGVGFQYGGVGMYEWTQHQLWRVRLSNKINKTTYMNVLPNLSGWDNNGDVLNNSILDNTLIINDTTPNTANSYRFNISANSTDRVFIEFRMKVISTNAFQGGNVPLCGICATISNDYTSTVSFNTTGFWIQDANTPQTTSTFILFNTTNDFHNYKYEVEYPNVKLYIDGNQAFNGKFFHNNSKSLFRVGFGSSSTITDYNIVSNSIWEWVSFGYGLNTTYNFENVSTGNLTSKNISLPSNDGFKYIFKENHSANNISFNILNTNNIINQINIVNNRVISSLNTNIKLNAIINNSSDNSIYYWGIDKISLQNNTAKFYSNGTIDFLSNNDYDTQTNFSVIPSSNSINVTISTWNTTGDYKKQWNESSSNSSVTTQHTIGDFPSLTNIEILIDGVSSAVIMSNSSGYISFNYVGGYSEHQFETQIYSQSLQASKTATCSGISSYIPITIPLFGLALMILAFGVIIFQIRGTLGEESQLNFTLISVSVMTAIIGFGMLLVGNYLIYSILNVTGC